MQFSEFKDSLQASQEPPPGISTALQALWHAGKGEWAAAHDVTQIEGDENVDWVHAHLHRQEGDLPNAGYWYRRAGRAMPTDISVEAEWEHMVNQLLLVEN